MTPRSTEEALPEAARLLKPYEAKKCRKSLGRRSIKSRMSRKGKDSSEKLGRHRWAVERTLSWLNCYRRLKIRYEWQADIHQAFLHLRCTLICWTLVQRLR
jgi:transposase